MNGWGIFQAHQHDKPFVETKQCCYSSEMYMIWMHLCLKKAVCHINSCPDFAFHTVVQNVINLRKWVAYVQHLSVVISALAMLLYIFEAKGMYTF